MRACCGCRCCCCKVCVLEGRHDSLTSGFPKSWVDHTVIGLSSEHTHQHFPLCRGCPLSAPDPQAQPSPPLQSFLETMFPVCAFCPRVLHSQPSRCMAGATFGTSHLQGVPHRWGCVRSHIGPVVKLGAVWCGVCTF